MKKLFKDKRGMTLTEILVAITILMLVIVFTTPVMLSSYEGLYTAGEYTKETYEAKSEIEDYLATRNSINIFEGFKVNFEGIGEVAAVNGKRAVSSLYNSLETIFTGGQAYVTIISSKEINDDKYENQISLQTTNVSFKDKFDLSFNRPQDVQNGLSKVDISVYIPQKYRNDGTPNDTLETIYTTGDMATIDQGGAERSKVIANSATGRIVISVRDLEFTKSPAKIEVTYRDENDKVRKTSCYLTIKTPTIMMVGYTNYGDYYTTAGVEEIKNKDGTTTKQLLVAARKMDTTGTVNTKGIPAGTVFKSVNWITEQNALTGDFPTDIPYDPNYYVLTGTNGAIYRTYTFTDYNVGTKAVLGKVDLPVTSGDQNTFIAKYHSLISQNGKDVVGLKGPAGYTLDDPQGTIVYPAVWGGDFSHIFAYSGYNKSAGYLGNDAWYTQTAKNSGVGQEGYYSNFANFQYYYNGYGFNHSYTTQNSKKLSYILTELPYSLRVGGFMDDCGDFDMGHNRIWERPIKWNSNGTAYTSAQEVKNTSKLAEGYWYMNASGTADEKVIRCAIVKDDASDWDYDERYLNEIPTYWANNHWTGGNQGRWGDSTWAQLRLKGITTVSTNFLYNQRGLNDTSISSYKFVYNTNTNQSKIAVTDSVYIPGEGMFYVGTVATYAVVNQLDSVSTAANYGMSIRNNGENNDGGITTYYIMGNDEGTATTIHKYSSSMWGRDDSTSAASNITVFKDKTAVSDANLATANAVDVNSDASREFFVCRSYGGQKSQVFDDLSFTMGFTSNREMVYSKIVYGKNESGAVVEAMKSYEPLYFLSHYDDVTASHFANCYMNDYAATKSSVVDEDNPNSSSNGYSGNVTGGYFNTMNNDYYNVWFPGEMYNLTKVATKDGICVAVGYAVSGSTYTWMNPNQTTNSSTALGSVYNDGVLAAIRLGADTSFTNLLYFKDNSGYRSKGVENGFDDLSLADGTVSSFSGNLSYRNVLAGGDVNWNYGTHARTSVQFTDVDISIEYIKSGTSEVATYYAYYADNQGRLFKSKIAQKTTAANATEKPVPQMVSYISDRSTADSAPSYMQEIKINNQSLGAFFTEISTVRCAGDYIVISGHSNKSKRTDLNFVIGQIQQSADQTSNTIEWKLLKIEGAADYYVEDALILDGYLYLTGQSAGNKNNIRGYLYAMPLEDITRAENGDFMPFNPNLFADETAVQDRIFSIDGHADT